MYLIDTNIFLEILLEQEKSKECEALINKIAQSDSTFYVSSFTIHSIEVIMTKHSNINELSEFLLDIISSKIIKMDTSISDESDAIKNVEKFKLDFDDSLQLHICKSTIFKL